MQSDYKKEAMMLNESHEENLAAKEFEKPVLGHAYKRGNIWIFNRKK